jgi:hypothetical protein
MDGDTYQAWLHWIDCTIGANSRSTLARGNSSDDDRCGRRRLGLEEIESLR